MSLNYRKLRAQRTSNSHRRIILILFERDYQYFPSMREIRDELISAQMNEIETSSYSWHQSMNFNAVKGTYKEKWQLLFDFEKLGNIDKPLSPKILSNPNHPVTRHILYLYSMESFIYSQLNRASREKDATKI